MFGFAVIDGLYCSWRCAGRSGPSEDPADWPREHFTKAPHSDRRRPKHGYLTQGEAEQAAIWNHKTAYRCSYCSEFHIGSRRPVEVPPGPGA